MQIVLDQDLQKWRECCFWSYSGPLLSAVDSSIDGTHSRYRGAQHADVSVCEETRIEAESFQAKCQIQGFRFCANNPIGLVRTGRRPIAPSLIGDN